MQFAVDEIAHPRGHPAKLIADAEIIQQIEDRLIALANEMVEPLGRDIA